MALPPSRTALLLQQWLEAKRAKLRPDSEDCQAQIAFRLENMPLHTASKELQQLTETFLPAYCRTARLLSGGSNSWPLSAELFLDRTQLDADSLAILIKALDAVQLSVRGMSLKENALGVAGGVVLAAALRRWQAPVRFLSLLRCGLTPRCVEGLVRAMLDRPDIYPRLESGIPTPMWLDVVPSSEEKGDLFHEEVLALLDGIRPGLVCAAVAAGCGIRQCNGPAGALLHIRRPGRQVAAAPVAQPRVTEEDELSSVSSATSDGESEGAEIEDEEEEEDELSKAAWGAAEWGRIKARLPSDILLSSSGLPLAGEENEEEKLLRKAYLQLLQDGFLWLAQAAVNASVFPAELVRDLSDYYLNGLPPRSLPVGWRVQQPTETVNWLLLKAMHQPASETASLALEQPPINCPSSAKDERSDCAATVDQECSVVATADLESRKGSESGTESGVASEEDRGNVDREPNNEKNEKNGKNGKNAKSVVDSNTDSDDDEDDNDEEDDDEDYDTASGVVHCPMPDRRMFNAKRAHEYADSLFPPALAAPPAPPAAPAVPPSSRKSAGSQSDPFAIVREKPPTEMEEGEVDVS